MSNRLPADWEPHRLTIVAWPTRRDVWKDQLEAAYSEYSELIRVISRVEPVLVVAREEDVEYIDRSVGDCDLNILRFPIDDGWIRDNGPLFCDIDGRLVGVDFDFNSWGERFSPSDGDRSVGGRLCEYLGVRREAVPWVLEGGSISSNGQGAVLASAEAVLHPSRNGPVGRGEAETLLTEHIGVDNVYWIPHGLIEDLKNTDGHVDNVAVFVDSDTVLMQSCDEANPNYARLRDNIQRLHSDAPHLRIIECAELPYTELSDGDLHPVPYLNFSLARDLIILPTVGSKADTWAEGFFADLFPDRSVEFTPAYALTFGGGGPHCVTMQVPEVPPR